ncbi:MAG: alpha-ketoglutarate-dependent dioxygenase AlkB [Aestuariibacter sp.]
MLQSSLGFEFPTESHNLALPDADIVYEPDFLNGEEADILMQSLQDTLAWRQDHIRVCGRDVLIPRLQAWYGEPEAQYTYSGLLMTPHDWTRTLRDLKTRCEQRCDCRFNSVLANLYRDGSDSMGMHSDDEPELGALPTIASLTLGATRVFKLKHKHTAEVVDLPLGNGSLLVMKGKTQQFWQHGINKTKRSVAARMNLTFRYILAIKNEL